ncbi:ATP-dependent DNA helicase [Frankliniella fusca]|uniref:ATP-dependent DNA helicase n=1 Tax=Frankliniella fusca TaxID=407009 RepID=A0AAE1LWT6_9NEOP|nr:ATP-dependent DNA helicase [Frankliniella fusca]
MASASDISFKPNLVHPCEKSVSDCTNLEEDLVELVNRVQRHTKCSASYCLRSTKDSKTPVCRFGFPKPLCEMSEILVKENNIELQYACNDVLLNKYNPWVLQTWRSNIDYTAIVSDEILSRYIAKYAAKCEVKSNSYDDLLKNILSNNQSDDENCKKIIRKLLISTCAERDYSAQEVMFILMGFPLYHSSRQFVILNLKDSVWESILSCQSENNRKVFIQHYIDRPQYLEQISLLECAKCYYVKSGKWILRKKICCCKSFPSVDSELECLKNCCILNIPWRSIDEFNVPEDILKNKLDSISYNWNDTDECEFLLEWSDNECDSQSENFDEDDDNDWKIISRLNSRKQTKKISTGENKNFNWDYAIDKYDLTEIHTICETIESEKVEEYVEIIDYTLLSEDQKRAFQHFCSLVNDCVKGGEWSKERLIFVQGRAGYGKSFLLKAMKSYCFQKLGLDSYAVVAYSGVAAKNVNGITIHSFLKIPPKPQYFRDLNGDELHKFQEKKKEFKNFIY